ncbi:hypothetical protein [Campylobacter fetus]|uniref:hypothetical protein n=1 Tax=Campylobacter fetus TaxID=196 RepID=UPI000FCB6FFC|nr:hypothetical protein [Campylobacter fetus]RUT50985.1 hypothetical protein BWK67_00230 [Campylobacter fetus]RUT51713.1 hypothetical protein BWK51_00230 [Campylobacter fetus]
MKFKKLDYILKTDKTPQELKDIVLLELNRLSTKSNGSIGYFAYVFDKVHNKQFIVVDTNIKNLNAFEDELIEIKTDIDLTSLGIEDKVSLAITQKLNDTDEFRTLIGSSIEESKESILATLAQSLTAQDTKIDQKLAEESEALKLFITTTIVEEVNKKITGDTTTPTINTVTIDDVNASSSSTYSSLKVNTLLDLKANSSEVEAIDTKVTNTINVLDTKLNVEVYLSDKDSFVTTSILDKKVDEINIELDKKADIGALKYLLSGYFDKTLELDAKVEALENTKTDDSAVSMTYSKFLLWS